MTALTAARSTPSRAGGDLSFGVAANTQIFLGALACLNAAGDLVPGATATTLIAIGRAEQTVKGSATAGEVPCEVRAGVYRWANSAAGDLITKTEIGKDVYIVDDQTVAKTSGGATRSIAGKVVSISLTGDVWVRTGVCAG